MNNQMNSMPQQMPQQMMPQVNSPYVPATQPKPAAPKKKLSGIAVFSMIFAIIFAIAASCMSFLPILNVTVADRNDQTKKASYNIGMLEYTVFGDLAKLDDDIEYYNNTPYLKTPQSQDDVLFKDKITIGNAAGFYKASSPEDNTIYTSQGKLFIIFTTVLFFTMFAVALFVIIGKLLSKAGGGRAIAFIFSFIGLLCSGGYFVYVMLTVNSAIGSELLRKYIYTIAPGYGMILQTSFALLTFIFCCMALTKKSALKDKVPKAPPAAFYAGVPANNNVQNVVNPVADPHASFNPQINTPATNYAPPTPAPQQVYQTPAPAPVSATQDTLSFEIPAVPQQPMQAPVQTEQPTPVVPVEQQAPAAPAEQPAAVSKIGKLEGIGGDYHGIVIDLNPGEKIIIGSDPSCSNIVRSSPAGDVSPSHCTVSFEEDIDNYRVTDTSTTGTFFNGKKLPQNRGIFLPRGTVLSFGTCETSFRLQ